MLPMIASKASKAKPDVNKNFYLFSLAEMFF